MSSEEEDYNDVENSPTILPNSKKRRVQRACDTCRRKKIRCDGGQMPGNRCSNCIAFHFQCTYVEAAKKRGPPKGYVESLENRLEKMEKLLQKVCPGTDFSHEVGGRINRETWRKGNTSASTSAHALNPTSSTYSSANSPLGDLVPSEDEDVVTLKLSESLKTMDLNGWRSRFIGKSSGVTLVKKAIDLKKEVTGSGEHQARIQFHRVQDEPYYPWERAARIVEEPKFEFPDEELGMRLVDLYFVHLNPVAPLLHRPSFERQITQGVHLHKSSFGTVYLLVCAIASRYSDDPRVFVDDVEGGVAEHSAGWKYYEQVQMVRRTLLGPPCLEDLQTFYLSVIFLDGTSAPQSCWTIVGIGIRLAQDVGAHRRKSYSEKPTVEGELWKRAFWMLVFMDRHISSTLGRSCAIQDEDFDLDFPIECDDEYWEHPDPEQAFKQPPDKPSTISYFISFLKLNNILSFALRTIYSINKSKILLGFVGQQWEQHIVAKLDSSLNKWIDEVPDHLRWDPTRTNPVFFMQSASLYANYYYVQIFIHRPFIPSPHKSSPLSFPSLAICTNAARSCSHVIDIYRRRANGYGFTPHLQMHAFIAGIVLLLNIWGGKKSGLSTDPLKEMADVHKCMTLLKSLESRWHTIGRHWHILYELASVGDLPLPQPSHRGGTKRGRNSDSSIPVSRPLSTPEECPRTIVGTRRITRKTHSHSQSQQSSQQRPPPSQALQSYNLPVYSNDLGRLPLHGQVDFPVTVPTSTSSSSMHLSNMWSSSLSSEPQQPAPAPITGHTFAHGDAHSIDNLYSNQISNPFGNFSAQQTHNSTGHGNGSQAAANDLQAFVDASVASGVEPSMMQTNGMLDVDPATLAMWSSAPTGFGVNDWGAYLSNVYGIANPDGPTGSGFHGQHGWQGPREFTVPISAVNATPCPSR